jgi:alanyl aminopeptidase
MVRKELIVGGGALVIGIAVILFLSLRFVSEPAEVPKEISYPAEVPLLQLPEGVTPTHYALDLKIDPSRDTFSGSVAIDLEFSTNLELFYLHGEDLDVGEVYLESADGEKLVAEYEQVHRSGVVRIRLAEIAGPGDYTLYLAYVAEFSDQLDGIYSYEEDGLSYAFSQMQAISARRALPCFDEPNFKTPFEVTISAPEGLSVITNGQEEVGGVAIDGWEEHGFQVTQPLTPSLLAFAVGPFDVVEWEALEPTDRRTRSVPLRGITTKGKGEGMSYILSSTETIVAYFEDYFDVAYPYAKLDIVAVPDFQAGAMENVGAIFYRETLSLVNEDTPQSAFRGIVETHAHEVSHQWFGNLVTPIWWDDIWLNESFATWISYKAAKAWEPSWNFSQRAQRGAHGVMGRDSYPSSRQVRQPILEQDDLMNIFDPISYAKGSGVLTMFEAYVGEEAFRDGIRLHLQRYEHGVADADDFVLSLAEGSGRGSIATAFESFLYQPGVPVLDMTLSCGISGTEVTVRQERFFPLGTVSAQKQVWTLPLCYRTEQGDNCVLISKPVETFNIGASCPQYFMPNRNADGYYLWSLDTESLDKLIGNFASLSPNEVMSTSRNSKAWFESNTASAADVIALSRLLAEQEDPEIALTPIGILEQMRETMVTEESLPELLALYRELYGSRQEALGLEPTTAADAADGQGTTRLRRAMVSLMGVQVQDPGVRAALREKGIALIGYKGDGEIHREAIIPELRQIAMGVAFEEEGVFYGEALLSLLKTNTDGSMRRAMYAALAMGEDAEFAKRVIDDLIVKGALRSNEVVGFGFQIMGNKALRATFLEWLQEGDHLIGITDRLPTDEASNVLFLGTQICDVVERDAYFEFMGRAAHGIGGAPRALAQTREAIDQCIALKQAKSADVNEALKAMRQ